jgi:hypothetical protein
LNGSPRHEAALCGCLNADEPWFETTRLFALTPKNKPNYRIPSITQAPNGDILDICEKRNDGPVVCFRRSVPVMTLDKR